MDKGKRRLAVTRLVGAATILLGLNYIVWRYAASLNVKALWFAVPMVLAETYGVIQMLLFVMMTWRSASRSSPPPPEGVDVDVFITTYNEPVKLVRTTARAATRIAWERKTVHVLDDGDRPEMRAMAEELGCNYIARGPEWTGKPRHAKAGNVNNALNLTRGEFVLILDADQIPSPDILARTLGYFDDEKVAFVQTPQYFYNLPPGDPFGNDASLFYGPIQQGKDAWNAAFFCGSNAVLRREALMQLGLSAYVREMEERTRTTLRDLERRLRRAACADEARCEAAKRLVASLREARAAQERGEPLERVSDLMRDALGETRRIVAEGDLAGIAEDMRELASGGDEAAMAVYRHIAGNLNDLAARTAPAAAEALGLSPVELGRLNLTRPDEALPIQALATISVTEDMATAMELHALGWKSVFHPEVLAYGLAPEDLGTSLKQRLRWAQGTIQVLLRSNPLTKKGLSLPQRLMYFATILSYFNGFFNLILLLAPVIYFITLISPLSAWSIGFFARFLPFFLMNKLMFRFAARGIPVRRGDQYELALFPLSINAVVSVLLGRNPGFVVTAKERQGGADISLVWPQLAVILAIVGSAAYGLIAWLQGRGLDNLGFFVNLFWSGYNTANLSVIVKAVFYKPPAGWEGKAPKFAGEP